MLKLTLNEKVNEFHLENLLTILFYIPFRSICIYYSLQIINYNNML